MVDKKPENQGQTAEKVKFMAKKVQFSIFYISIYGEQ